MPVDLPALLTQPYWTARPIRKAFELAYHILALSPRVIFGILNRDKEWRAQVSVFLSATANGLGILKLAPGKDIPRFLGLRPAARNSTLTIATVYRCLSARCVLWSLTNPEEVARAVELLRHSSPPCVGVLLPLQLACR